MIGLNISNSAMFAPPGTCCGTFLTRTKSPVFEINVVYRRTDETLTDTLISVFLINGHAHSVLCQITLLMAHSLQNNKQDLRLEQDTHTHV